MYQDGAAQSSPLAARSFNSKNEKENIAAAKKLDFERAAKLRDQIRDLEQAELKIG